MTDLQNGNNVLQQNAVASAMLSLDPPLYSSVDSDPFSLPLPPFELDLSSVPRPAGSGTKSVPPRVQL